jgi:hypothetical protein
MKESRLVVTVNRDLNVNFASEVLLLWLAVLPEMNCVLASNWNEENKFYENYSQQNSAHTAHHVLHQLYLPTVMVMNLY